MQQDDQFRILYDLQEQCNDLSQKIDSIINMMGVFNMYMQYSSMMGSMPEFPSTKTEGRDESMNPKDLQRFMNAAKQGDTNTSMNQDEFDAVFETLKQGKSPEEIQRMEQMVQMAKSFMK